MFYKNICGVRWRYMNFEFGEGVSITSGVESCTHLGSVIMSISIKVSIVQVDDWYCEVASIRYDNEIFSTRSTVL